MKQNKLKNIVHGMTVAVVLAGSLFARNVILNERKARKIEEKAKVVAMTHYIPVGNGGALAVQSGWITSNRAEMYQKMQKAYEEVMRKNNKYNAERDPYLNNTKVRSPYFITPENW